MLLRTPRIESQEVEYGSISGSFKNEKTKKEEKPFDFSSVVDDPFKLSNFFRAISAFSGLFPKNAPAKMP